MSQSSELTPEQIHVHRNVLYMAFHSDRPDWEKEAIAEIAEKSGHTDMAEEMRRDLSFENFTHQNSRL